MSWRRLIHGLRAWTEEPEPDPTDLLALAAGALFLLALPRVRRCLGWLLARRNRRRVAARANSDTIVRGVVLAPSIASHDARDMTMGVVAASRWWPSRPRRGYLVSRLHLDSLDGRGIVFVSRGQVTVIGRMRRSDGLTHRFAAGDRVDVRAVLAPATPRGAPYRGVTASIAQGIPELRIAPR